MLEFVQRHGKEFVFHDDPEDLDVSGIFTADEDGSREERPTTNAERMAYESHASRQHTFVEIEDRSEPAMMIRERVSFHEFVTKPSTKSLRVSVAWASILGRRFPNSAQIVLLLSTRSIGIEIRQGRESFRYLSVFLGVNMQVTKTMLLYGFK